MFPGSSEMLLVTTVRYVAWSVRMFSCVNPNEWPISWHTCARLRLETVTNWGL